MQRADPTAKTVEWRHGLAFRRFGEIFNRGNDVTHRLLEIRLQVAMTYNSLVGVEVNQNDGPLSKQADFRNNRPFQRHNDRPGPDTLQCELNLSHQWPPLLFRNKMTTASNCRG